MVKTTTLLKTFTLDHYDTEGFLVPGWFQMEPTLSCLLTVNMFLLFASKSKRLFRLTAKVRKVSLHGVHVSGVRKKSHIQTFHSFEDKLSIFVKSSRAPIVTFLTLQVYPKLLYRLLKHIHWPVKLCELNERADFRHLSYGSCSYYEIASFHFESKIIISRLFICFSSHLTLVESNEDWRK